MIMRWLEVVVLMLGACGACSGERAAPAAPAAAAPVSVEADVERAEAPPARPSYDEAKRAIERRRRELAAGGAAEDEIEREIIASVYDLSRYWLGTRWGLGAPQTSEPQVGQINCGTFVGTVLRDAGFNVKVSKLQRQPSQLIIESFVSGDRVRKYSNASMEKFLASVKEMGPGLFIIGLDFHVGFLIQTDAELRFVHASYETGTVVDEAAADATPIVSSKYRVVGKLLTRRNIDDWLSGARIRVKGNW